MTKDPAIPLAERFRRHAASIPDAVMYHDLMQRCADDIEAGGPVSALMRDHAAARATSFVCTVRSSSGSSAAACSSHTARNASHAGPGSYVPPADG